MKLSQGLVHTSFMAHQLWTDTLEQLGSGCVVKWPPHPPGVIPSHYIICNDTDEHLVIGQADTGEEVPLPSNCCLGYSWFSHAHLPQKLRLCLREQNPSHMQWTASISMDSVGVNSVSVPMGVCLARAYVKVSSIGGVQKQVKGPYSITGVCNAS